MHRYGSWITGYVSHGGMATHQPSTILGYFVAFLWGSGQRRSAEFWIEKKKNCLWFMIFFWSVHVVLTWTEKWKQYFLNNSYRAECYVHLTFKQKYVLISFGYKEHEMSLCNLLYLKGWICWCILVVQQHFNNAIKTIFKAIQCHWNGTKWVEHISQFVINPAKRHYWCFSFFSHRALKVMWFS